MFCDEAHIYIKAGDGGNGVISFHREKFVAKGPPDGGDGGKGGDIIFKVNENLNTLTDFLSKKKFKADPGKNGEKNNRTGHSGEDYILEVPLGTQIIDEEGETLLADLSHLEDMLFAARGGKGGLGNAHFVSSVQQAPNIAERGEPGEERYIHLELKLVADVAIIGMPNAGKSTLISSISNARPKIADYPFTTLVPNLGVVEVGDKHLVVCDVPGLIEDAHKGKGLGDKFLKHIERCKVLIHLLDGNDPNIVDSYKQIRKELDFFSHDLAKKKEIIALNKIDSFDDETTDLLLQELKKAGIKKVFPISAVSKKGTKELLFETLKIVEKENAKLKKELEEKREQKKEMVFRPHLKSMKMSHFEVVKEGEDLRVRGNRIEQLVKMTDFAQRDAEFRVYNNMKKAGILKALKKAGAEEGAVFWVGDKKFEYEEWKFK